MAIVRTIIWVLIAVAMVLFAINNWQPVEVRIWQTLVLETKLPALVILAFLIGIVPMWLFHRASLWRAKRRIASLEATLARPSTMPAPVTPAIPPAE